MFDENEPATLIPINDRYLPEIFLKPNITSAEEILPAIEKSKI
ncbi:hypothetical protein TPHV1_60067 [Treponema phagedenis]|uniref:Uncharacterized protein n=1 Tax=Treponema phagedenis TaxID=162 RepID=A0A0B7GWN3_TREPH|nr:hypothetical protein TPHV1_60067 [Treponema phagedenis]